MKWRYRDVWVYYTLELDGFGSRLARPFAQYLRQAGNPPYGRCLEWCAGPGFIGVTLLRAGLIKELVLADKNPALEPWIARTRKANGLDFTFYRSDNFQDIPADERFDLVVGNPPSYCNLNPDHPLFDARRDDPRPHDPDWTIHQAFYATVRRYLRPGGELFISEVEPHAVEVVLPKTGTSIPYDLRPEEPLRAFRRMIEGGGLDFVAAESYLTSGGVTFYVVRSGMPSFLTPETSRRQTATSSQSSRPPETPLR